MNTAKIKITNGNLKNNHFYLTSCLPIFPKESIGGANKQKISSRLITLRPLGDENVETDIDGTKNIFRKRGWVRALFQRSSAQVGHHVCMKQDPDGSYHVWIDTSIEG